MTVAIIDYGSGNLRSAAKAIERAAQAVQAAGPIVVTSDPEVVRRADRIVLPGVGAFRDCREGIDAIPRMLDTLEVEVRQKGKPFLGICVGMQLMATSGHEHLTTKGFDWIAGQVRLIEPRDPSLKIPHIGWNTLRAARPHPLLDELAMGPDGLHAYFVHSYALIPDTAEDSLLLTDYGEPLTAMVVRDNMAGTQFHPEKSQQLGLRLLANFLRWRP